MTKDRRLGRGLAALLGTPIEESNSQDNASIASPKDTNANSSPANASTATARGVDPIARNQTIRALTDEAHQRTAASEHASLVLRECLRRRKKRWRRLVRISFR